MMYVRTTYDICVRKAQCTTYTTQVYFCKGFLYFRVVDK